MALLQWRPGGFQVRASGSPSPSGLWRRGE
jgi:hypothetical protein